MLAGVSVSADLEFHLSSTTPPAITVRLKEPGRTSPCARLPLLPWNGFRARLNRNTVTRKRNRSHDTIHCCQHLPLTAGITNLPRIGLRAELQRNDDRKAERY